MLQEFLDKEEYRKYKIIHILERSTNMLALKEDILNKLEISSFIYTRLIETLVFDLEKFGLFNSMKVVINSNELFLETDGTVSSEIILEKYVQDSIKYQMFCTVFTQKFKSLNEFALFYSISYPTAHKSLKELNEDLKKKGMIINKKFQVEGENELELRLFILELFNRVEQETFAVYPIKDKIFIDNQLEQFISLHSQKEVDCLTPFQASKTRHYLSIIETRIRQNYILQEISPLVETKLYSLKTNLYTYATNFFTRFLLETNNLFNETSALVLFYATCYSQKNDSLPSNLYPFIKEGYQLLYEGLIEKIERISILEEEVSQFEMEILALHTYLSGVSLDHDSFMSSLNLSYFQETYPQVFYFFLDHIKLLDKKIPELYRHRKFLLLNYILIFLNTFPKEIFMDPVNIHVNFTLGTAYNDFVIDTLGFFSSTGTVKISSLEMADVVLTNSREFGNTTTKEYVIWLSPPRPVDWSNLAQLIVTTRETKIRAVSKKRK